VDGAAGFDLSEQKLYAYDDQQRLLYAASCRLGLAATPTPTRRFDRPQKKGGQSTANNGGAAPITASPRYRNVMCLVGGGLIP